MSVSKKELEQLKKDAGLKNMPTQLTYQLRIAMSAKDVSAIIEWFFWMGAQHGVIWTDEERELRAYAEMRR